MMTWINLNRRKSSSCQDAGNLASPRSTGKSTSSPSTLATSFSPCGLSKSTLVETEYIIYPPVLLVNTFGGALDHFLADPS